MILRNTTVGDLGFVIEIEQIAADSGYVTTESIETHTGYLMNDDFCHLIIDVDSSPMGFIILSGLNDKNESIEFRRIVVAERGRGYGRKALQLTKQMVFEELNAHRLWLDVVESNHRARQLYESEGFSVEGVWRECFKNGNGRESLVFMSSLKWEYRKAKSAAGM